MSGRDLRAVEPHLHDLLAVATILEVLADQIAETPPGDHLRRLHGAMNWAANEVRPLVERAYGAIEGALHLTNAPT